MGSGRLGLSAIDKREIWSRWKAGETLHEIGRAYGKCHHTIRCCCLAAVFLLWLIATIVGHSPGPALGVLVLVPKFLISRAGSNGRCNTCLEFIRRGLES